MLTRTEQYRKSTIPACQRLLNGYFQEKGSAGNAVSEGARYGAGAGLGEGQVQEEEGRSSGFYREAGDRRQEQRHEI